MDPTSPVKRPSLVALLFLISFASSGAVLYAPALPSIATFFGVSTGAAQLTMTLFLVGYAFGQLPYGPLSNFLGRKPTLYMGCTIAFFGSAMAALSGLSPNLFWLLCVGRIVQALGMAVGLPLTFTLIADTMDKHTSRRAISLVVLGFAIMPGISVAIGGALTDWINWQSCFIFLALYSLFLLYLSTRMPKTGPEPHLGALHPTHVLKGYWEQVRDRRVVLGSLIIGGATAIIYIFSSKGPFIGIDILKLDPDTYGLLNLIPTAGFFLGSAISQLLPKETRVLPLVIGGLSLITLGVLGQLFFFLAGQINLWTLFLPMAIAYIGPVFPYSALSAAITAQATDKSNASAVMSFLNMGSAMLGVFLSNVFYPESALAMPLLMTAIVVVMLVLFARLRTLVVQK